MNLLNHPVNITRPRDLEPLSIGLQDAARLLGVSDRHLQKLAIAGEIPSALIGARRVFVMESLRAWLKARETDGRPNDPPVIRRLAE